MQHQEKPEPEKPTFTRFFVYFLLLFFLITALSGLVQYQQNSRERVERIKTEISEYQYKETPKPSPTLNPYFPSYSRPDYKLSQSATPKPLPDYAPSFRAPSYESPYDSGGYSGGKTVSVRGYYRKNGTYVAPYMRSAPRRR